MMRICTPGHGSATLPSASSYHSAGNEHILLISPRHPVIAGYLTLEYPRDRESSFLEKL